MFDEFRTPTDETPQENPLPPEGELELPESRNRKSESRFLGMTSLQRFVVALMLFFMTCVLGAFCLIVTERVVPPIF